VEEQVQAKNKFVVPIGPQHPALKEPGHFEFTVDGEIVVGATVRLGYAHRGIEKGCEDRNWAQGMYLVERVCGICSHIHAMTFALGAEKLANVTVPPRAQAIRLLVGELERIHSHMLWLGVQAHEGGFDTLFMYTWRDRETVMDLLEMLTGNRVNYSANVLGGVKCDVTDPIASEILKGMDFLEQRARYYLDIVSMDETFLGRTRDVGTMTKEQALRIGAIGPTGRASGLERDVRLNAPYAGYVDFPIHLVTEQGGDLLARTLVRVKELFESIRLIREVLDKLPPGEISVRMPRRIPEGAVVSRVEAPRGEVLYYMKSAGGDKPERIKIRTPSICNWATVMATAVGHKLADMPMLLAGIDPCFSCSDRSVKIVRRDDEQHMTWEALRQYGNGFYR